MSFNPFDSADKAGPSKSDSPQDALDFLNADDDKEEDKEDKKPVKKATSKDKDDDTKDKDDDIDDDLEDDSDDEDLDDEDGEDDDEDKALKLKTKDDDIDVDSPPKKEEIRKVYPEFFKKFPWFEKMMFRDRQLQELFGSYDDAVESHSRAELLSQYETELSSGKSEALFKNLKDNDSKAFAKVVDTLLPTIYKVDKDAYYEITSDVARRIIVKMITDGKRLKNEELETAGRMVNQFIFNTEEVAMPKEYKEETKDDTVDKEREAFYQEKLDDAVKTVTTKVVNTLRNTISEYIDPRDQMSAFEKKGAIKEAMSHLDEMMEEDAVFRKQIVGLWNVAKKEKLSKAATDRIKSAYLGKAKTYLRTVIKKARAEVLADKTPKREKEEKDRRGPIKTGHSRPKARNEGNGLKPGETALEFLSRD